MDYFGSVVNTASRIANGAFGGQILISSQVWGMINPNLKAFGDPIYKLKGAFTFKGLKHPQEVVELVPCEMPARSFPEDLSGGIKSITITGDDNSVLTINL